MPAPSTAHLPPLLGAATAPNAPPAWASLPDTGVPRFDAARMLAHWARLHAGQVLPAPESAALIAGWVHYHNGRFAEAAAAGLALGEAGLALADEATAVYANYVEPREAMRLALFRQVAERAHARVAAHPEDTAALYWHAYALERYAQAVSVGRALAQGLGSRLKESLERLLKLQPLHAYAHFALGAFHAEVINKVGPLVGRMTYGVRAQTALSLFERGLQLHPDSPAGLMAYARTLLVVHGESRLAEATQLYERAAALEPQDVREKLDTELARAGLRD